MASYNTSRRNPITGLMAKFGESPKQGFSTLKKGEENLTIKKEEEKLEEEAKKAQEEYYRELEARYNHIQAKKEEPMTLQKALEILKPQVGRDLTDQALKKREQKAKEEAIKASIQAKKDREEAKQAQAERYYLRRTSKATKQDLEALVSKFNK